MKITRATLVDYLNNELSPAERAQVGAALERDPKLRAELGQLQRLHAGLQAAFDPIRDVAIAGRPPAGAFGRARPPRQLARVALLAAVVLASFWVVIRPQLPEAQTGGQVVELGIYIVPTSTSNPPIQTPFVPTPFVPTAMPTAPDATSVATPSAAALVPGSPEWYAHLTISPSLTLRGGVSGTALDIEVRGTIGYALITQPELDANPTILVALELNGPNAPFQLGEIAVDAESRAIAVDGTLAIATTPRGFDVFDISDPAHIRLVSSFADPQSLNTMAVALRAGRAYIAGQGAPSRLTIVDLSDPANPQFMSSLATAGPSADGLDIAGELAYVADSANGMLVIDISDPAEPRLLARFDVFGARSVRVAGDRAYLGTDSGLKIVDISDPAAPALLGSRAVGYGSVVDIAVDGSTVFASYANIGSSDFGGIEVYDLSDPTRPMLLGGYSGQAYANAVWSDGERAYVAHDRRGLVIMDLER